MIFGVISVGFSYKFNDREEQEFVENCLVFKSKIISNRL